MEGGLAEEGWRFGASYLFQQRAYPRHGGVLDCREGPQAACYRFLLCEPLAFPGFFSGVRR
jgi:hypothetical protein